ncbi:MAG TPA: alpha/beta fold hydrolase [Limnobacter sp.]|nr:alpha/beta fold hydrolase [Limnobacter sp.]
MLNRKTCLPALLMMLFSLTACSTAAEPGKYLAKPNWTSSFLSQVAAGQNMPDGVNNWACQPAENQNPVVLIHGTFSSSMYSFGALGPALANSGLCVFSMDYGALRPSDWFKGVGPVDESARKIAEFVTSVKTATGRDKVTLVGHSQGGLIGFYYLKMLKGYQHADRFVALAPSISGTTIAKTPKRELIGYCVACADQHPESELLKELRQGNVTVPGVKYSVLVTKNDKVVVPVNRQFVNEPGVQNIYIQDVLPGKSVSHSGMLYDPDTLKLIVRLVNGQVASAG